MTYRCSGHKNVKSDHSAIIDDLEKGPNFWKFNSNLVNDSAYCELLTIVILLHEKFLQFDWLRAVVFHLNLKYLHVKITTLFRVVV